MTWDKGLDYKQTYKLLLKKMNDHYMRGAMNSYCYALVLLIQLRNGSRVSEALKAAKLFMNTLKRKTKVKVKKRKDNYERLMVLPKEIQFRKLLICRDVLFWPEKEVLNRIKVYAKKVLGLNTHSLRYAYITYLLKQGINPSIIAKLTGHKRLDYILTYTQKKTAEEVLETMG